jgi:hypothetical protein
VDATDRGGAGLRGTALTRQVRVVVWLVLILVGVGLAGCGAQSSHDASLNFGSFAGYARFGAVHSVGAELTVPRITRRSSPGLAATWIGAQAISAGARAPFIQVGLNELRPDGKPDQYFAFWTDTARSFRPVPLFLVAPGDRLAASLVLADHRWMVAISDLANHRHARFTTTEEGHASFGIATWLQEDPLDVNHRRLAPYPELSGLQIAGLSENGHAPSAELTNVQWMSRGQQVLAPTVLDHDAFTLQTHPARLAAPARRYLTIEQALVDASTQPQAKLAAADASTGHAQEITWAKQLVTAQARAADAMRSTSLPRLVTRTLARDAPLRRRVTTTTRQLAASTAATFIAAQRQWAAAIKAAAGPTAALLRALNAPPVQAPPAALSQFFQAR